MEQKQNRIAPGAATDEPASRFTFRNEDSAPSADADPPLLSDCLDETLAETFPPGSRKPRHDGWTPEAIAGFLRALAASGVVDHAARAVDRSVASAYAFRNRRQGRAFARMWDAVLIHRTHARIASELQGRAIAGCVSVRKRDGEVVGEYHYYDNRLAMALLTRLDRLAERETASDAQLRALSEDLEDYLDCVAAGGDADAFVEARRPVLSEVEGAAEPTPEPAPPNAERESTPPVRVAGPHDYRDVDPLDIDVYDLNPAAQDDWTPDQWARARQSGFLAWLETVGGEPELGHGRGLVLRFCVERDARDAAARLHPAKSPPADDRDIRIDDLDTAAIFDWSEDQLARAWRSGFLHRLTPESWERLAGGDVEDEGEE